MSTMSQREKVYQQAVSDWVRWFRGVNNPETQKKVGQRQIGMLTAEKALSHYEVIYGHRQVPRVVLHVPGMKALESLQWALARMFPKVRSEVHVEEPMEKEFRQPKHAFGRTKRSKPL